MNTRTQPLRLAALLLGCGLGTLSAQPYVIDWHKVSGGGGAASGGPYRVCGTIGQHDAGALMAGGSYSVSSGFWAAFGVVQTPGAPVLTLALVNARKAIISWPSSAAAYVLQQNADLATTNWSSTGLPVNNDGKVNYVTVNSLPLTGKRFYRLYRP